MGDDRFSALSFVKREGPILPAQLAKEINTNILLSSAILSELAENKQVLVTNIKKGGSPLYYISGQEEKLQDLSKFLSVEDKEVYESLKNSVVIRDKTAISEHRISLRRSLKDFAIPLNVKLGKEYELFWKWYLSSNDDAKDRIKEIISGKKSDSSEDQREMNIPVKKEEEDSNKNEEVSEVSKPKESLPVSKVDTGVGDINNFFSENEMYVISQDVVRKNKELNFVVDLPSKIGSLRYFVKFKDKKTVTDADLIASVDEARSKKLPVLFLSKGQLAKKAEKYLNDNVSGQLVFKNI
ncbi:hypothetical protein HOA59_01845 [archaeon]|jgi:hypothetical protein|nr:hypothetical protein [archaeon]MBT6824159.1 hypothetical protein [archaeon]MBT7106997.1 hypothetical protein [archaeon]MBT7297609.1 hypothetical protein [archaeon]